MNSCMCDACAASKWHGHQGLYQCTKLKKPLATTAAERKRKQRERDKAQGLVRHDVKAHAEDWAEIKRFILDLETARVNK